MPPFCCNRIKFVEARNQPKDTGSCTKSMGARRSFSIQGGILLLLLSTLPVRHWRVYTEGRACSRCLPIAIGDSKGGPWPPLLKNNF